MSVAAHEILAGVVARSAAMQEILRVASRLAEARSPVLLEGESGTGKDLLAHWLHYKGPRRDGPLIKVHCPSIPEELLESELFGHEKGAFTDARHAKAGKIELAAGGTLFFDQVEDLSLPLQGKLLRVVEECRFERLGGTRTVEVDVRFVSASRLDLRRAVDAGTFRRAHHRRAWCRWSCPAAKAWGYPAPAEAFLVRERSGVDPGRIFRGRTAQALLGYRRERGACRRGAGRAHAGGETVPTSALPPHVLEEPQTFWTGRPRPPSLKEVEQAYIRHVLQQAGGSQTRAAAALGISRKALWEKRRRYGIP
jgi:DNA-binding NtrC family response regulator